MTPLRDLARDAYAFVDLRLREEGKAEPGLDRAGQERRAAALADQWLLAQSGRQVARGHHPLSRAEEHLIRDSLMRRLFGLGDLEPLLQSDDVENVYINGSDTVFVEPRCGPMRQLDYAVADSDEDLIGLVQRLAAREGLQERRWDPAHPVLDLTLRDGSRLHAVRDVVRRPTITIRLHRLVHVSLDDLVSQGVIDQRARALLGASVLARQTVLVSGPTGGGKTATVRALATRIPPEVRIVTIEDTYELFLDQDTDAHPNCVAMQARRANVEGRGRIPAAELFEAALRMAPGVLIVGEVRRPEEVEPMLDATAAGDAAGSLSTIHARSPLQAINRLQSLARRGPSAVPLDASAHMIADAIDFVVHVVARRDSRGRRRRLVTSIVEITGVRGGAVTTAELVRLGRDGPEWPDPLSDRRRELLAPHGYDPARSAPGATVYV